MFYYWTRALVNEKLRLGERQSYRLVPATPSGRIRSDSVVMLLNRSRVGIVSPLTPDEIPSLLTPDEIASQFQSSGITVKDLLRWTRRTRCVAPHFRLNKHTIRFSPRLFERWLAESSLARDRRRVG